MFSWTKVGGPGWHTIPVICEMAQQSLACTRPTYINISLHIKC